MVSLGIDKFEVLMVGRSDSSDGASFNRRLKAE
jgi:hypothetical protein